MNSIGLAPASEIRSVPADDQDRRTAPANNFNRGDPATGSLDGYLALGGDIGPDIATARADGANRVPFPLLPLVSAELVDGCLDAPVEARDSLFAHQVEIAVIDADRDRPSACRRGKKQRQGGKDKAECTHGFLRSSMRMVRLSLVIANPRGGWRHGGSKVLIQTLRTLIFS
jgi:hypothetical protein